MSGLFSDDESPAVSQLPPTHVTKQAAAAELATCSPQAALSGQASYQAKGTGYVPATSLVQAAVQQLCELPSAEFFETDGSMPTPLDFTRQGNTPEDLETFFKWGLEQSAKLEPNIESGTPCAAPCRSSTARAYTGSAAMLQLCRCVRVVLHTPML